MCKLLLLVLWSGLFGMSALAQETRLALVIGQTEYSGDLSRVKLANHEAGLIEASLRSVGFEVTSRRNLSRVDLRNELEDFRIRLERAGRDAVGFVYYTGHGAQHPASQDSYLLGVDAKLRGASDLAAYGVDMKSQRDAFGATGAKAVFLVFDACRNTPSIPGWKANYKGLSRVEAASDMLIAYSTSLGDLAEEGVYAPVLAEELKRPGRSAEAAFSAAQRRVALQTGRTQLPWYDPLMYSEVCFAGCTRQAALASEEHVALGQALSSGDVALLEEFLQRFPNSGSKGIVAREIAARKPAPVSRPVEAAVQAPAVAAGRTITGAREVMTLSAHGHSVISAAYSPDGQHIVTVTEDADPQVWDVASGQVVTTLSGYPMRKDSAVYSPDGRRIVTASIDRTAQVWDAASGQLVTKLKGHGSSVNFAAYSPDGQRIVTASSDGTAKVWDAAGGQLVTTLKGHGSFVNFAAYSPDGQRIVTASTDETAKVWDAVSGELIRTLSGHEKVVNAVAYSPDGQRILTGGVDGIVRIWDAASGQLVGTLNAGSVVFSIAFSPQGQFVVTGSKDKTAKVWEIGRAQPLVTLSGHTSYVFSAAFSPDGRYIVTGAGALDNTAKVWELEFAD